MAASAALALALALPAAGASPAPPDIAAQRTGVMDAARKEAAHVEQLLARLDDLTASYAGEELPPVTGERDGLRAELTDARGRLDALVDRFWGLDDSYLISEDAKTVGSILSGKSGPEALSKYRDATGSRDFERWLHGLSTRVAASLAREQLARATALRRRDMALKGRLVGRAWAAAAGALCGALAVAAALRKRGDS